MMATQLRQGSKDIFFDKRYGPGSDPKISVIQMVNFAEIKFVFA